MAKHNSRVINIFPEESCSRESLHLNAWSGCRTLTVDFRTAAAANPRYPVPKGAVLKPEYQTRRSAATGMEKDNQPASTIARAERAERLRDYFDLQLRFAEAVAATTALPLSEAVSQCTNFGCVPPFTHAVAQPFEGLSL